ncbi:MAG: response regulator transcription factor [Pseudomonadota bacterium]
MRILVVEDEKKVRSFITQALTTAGMAADSVSTVADLLVSLKTGDYDAIVLDRLLGGEDSLESLHDIRQAAPKAKVLVLSALSEVEERVKGLSEGADDYLGKPFHISELIARLRALSRRGEAEAAGARDTLIIYENLRIDLEMQRVSREGKKIDLTAKEFKMLCLLARNPGQVFPKTQILDEVWDIDHYPESNVVEVTIANLRSKVDREFKPLIHSRRGVGYWLGEK